MAHEVTIPSLGVAMEEALLVAWLKQEGETVEADEPIAEIETDKTTMDLVAPAAGTLGPHRYEEGATIPVGATVTVIYGVGEEVAEGGADPAQPVSASGEAARVGNATTPAGAQTLHSDERRQHRVSPRARRLAAPVGAGARSDLPAPAAADGSTGRFREIIAERVSESWRTIPHFVVVRDLDGEALWSAFGRARARTPSVKMTDFLLRAHALALAAGTEENEQLDLGLAVASVHGVVIPVIRDVLGLSLADLSAAREAAVNRGRSGKLAPDDAQLPASTLSNLGPFGADSFTGIVATGQRTLLTVGRLRELPWVVDGQVVVRHVLTATINADHRVLDGVDAAKVLAAFAAEIEDPARLAEEGVPSSG